MKRILIGLSVLSLALMFVLQGGAISFAAGDDCKGATTTEGAISCGVGGTTGVPVTKTPAKTINSTISKIINIMSVLGGVLAVVFLIVGGYRYITSAGDTAKVGSAKNTIMFALFGLIIVALAQVIVKFVLDAATQP